MDHVATIFLQVVVMCYYFAKTTCDDLIRETSNQICSSIAQTNNVPGLFEVRLFAVFVVYRFCRLLHEVTNNCNEDAQDPDGLKRNFLSNNVTCNDGTPAGFYVRRSENSKKWIVYLEGGWYCYDEENCRDRWARLKDLMSSEHWPPFRSGSGILSNDPNENPYWWHANHVFIPYCTSDIWSGRRSKPTRGSAFTFMGAIIVRQVIKELMGMGLKNANSLILAGSSAGGVGVMLNLEPVQRILIRYGTKVKLKGITDSGWFLDQPPFVFNSDIVTPVQAVKLGLPIWRSQIPHTCRTIYQHELWKCFIGYRIYPTISVPLFVFQWLFDEAQMKADNVGTPVTKQQWEYIHTMGEILRNSFQNVTSVFAPSCISHSILSRKDWHYIRIDNIPLPDALKCWERQTKSKFYENGLESKASRRISETTYSGKILPSTSAKQRKKKRRNSKQNKRGSKLREKNVLKNRLLRSTDSCSHRLIERCSWPQCNHSCPKIQNPLTGEELDLLELLKSFGLDMMNVASALGVDIHTLNNMNQRELISLLTQQVN